MSASNTPEGFEDLKWDYSKALNLIAKDDYDSSDIRIVQRYVEALEKFKEDIENERLLSKKYRVISPYSNYPVEDSIEFYYSADKFNESHFFKKDLKKISYKEIEAMYKKDPELYNWVGHDYNWVCVEGGNGYAQRIFNQAKFNNMIQHSTIVSDFIKSDIKLKISLIK